MSAKFVSTGISLVQHSSWPKLVQTEIERLIVAGTLSTGDKRNENEIEIARRLEADAG